jgi:hypothetical protein
MVEDVYKNYCLLYLIFYLRNTDDYINTSLENIYILYQINSIFSWIFLVGNLKNSLNYEKRINWKSFLKLLIKNIINN